MRKTTSALIIALLAVLSIQLAPATVIAQDEAPPRPIFINLTTGTEDLQKCSMALSLAGKSLEAGREATVFLNVHAIQLAVAGEETTMFNNDELISDKIGSLIEGGANVIVCPMCLGNSPYTVDDLLEGVQTAGGDNFFPPLDDGAAVFSY